MRSARGALLVAGALCALWAASASAEPRPAPIAQQTFDTAQECMQSGDAFEQPTCYNYGNGWVRTVERSSGGGAGAAFGIFLIVALVWAAVPAFICASLASSRGLSVGPAVLIGIVGGWLGVLIVAFAMKPTEVASRPSPEPRLAPLVPARDAASRLAELEDLKRRGLITPEEFASRREAILGQI